LDVTVRVVPVMDPINTTGPTPETTPGLKSQALPTVFIRELVRVPPAISRLLPASYVILLPVVKLVYEFVRTLHVIPSEEYAMVAFVVVLLPTATNRVPV
jgi:hypothetical protein